MAFLRLPTLRKRDVIFTEQTADKVTSARLKKRRKQCIKNGRCPKDASGF
jgi:hypothetical protein